MVAVLGARGQLRDSTKPRPPLLRMSRVCVSLFNILVARPVDNNDGRKTKKERGLGYALPGVPEYTNACETTVPTVE